MSVRMHITHSKTRSRRAHDTVTSATVVKTATGVRRRHFADAATGTYRGKELLTSVHARKKATKKVTQKAGKEVAAKKKKS